jgi:hypothetical protein
MRRLTAVLVMVLGGFVLLTVTPSGDVDNLKLAESDSPEAKNAGNAGGILGDRLPPRIAFASSSGLAVEGARALSELEDRFVGIWKLVAIERRRDGELLPVPGEYSTGLLIYTSTGHMSVQLMKPDREKFVEARSSGKSAKATLESYLAYFGTFTVNEADRTITHHKQGDLYPGRNPDSVRSYRFSDNRLMLVPIEAEKTVTTVIWERLE